MNRPPVMSRPRTKQVRHLQIVEPDYDADRPRTRGDCLDGHRPCPWVACKYNLYLDVSQAEGLRISRNCEPDEVPPELSCSLDIADRGGASLEDISAAINLTRERARQIESKALAHVERRARLSALRDFDEGGEKTRPSERSSSREAEAPAADPVDRETTPDTVVRVSFFVEPGDDRLPLEDSAWDRVLEADEAICDAVNRMMVKARHGGGIEARADDENKDREDTMENDLNKRGETQRMVLEAHGKLSSKLGRAPTSKEIYDHLGPEVAKNQNNVRMAMKRLERKGQLSAPDARASASPRPRRAAPRAVKGSKEPIVLSREVGSLPLRPDLAAKAANDPALAAIVRKRDELADKVATITHLIETW